MVNWNASLERIVRLPAGASIYHKYHVPKVIFLAVVARPRAKYGFDRKIGLWPFTLERKAKRSDARTGTVADRNHRNSRCECGRVQASHAKKKWHFRCDP